MTMAAGRRFSSRGAWLGWSSSSMRMILTLMACLSVPVFFQPHSKAVAVAAASVRKDNATLRLQNESSGPVTLNWVHPQTREKALMVEMPPGGTFSLQTFLGHEFEFKEHPSKTTGECISSDKVCEVVYHTIKTTGDQAFYIRDGVQLVEYVPEVPRDLSQQQQQHQPSQQVQPAAQDPRVVVDNCHKTAQDKLASLPKNASPEAEENIISQLKTCVEIGVSASLLRVNEQVEFHTDLRKQISSQIENHTCVDVNLDTSPDVDTREWTSEKDGVTRTIHVKLDRPASRIHVIENFATVEECDAMEETARPKLHIASVADGKGGTQVSNHRKAKQAGITPRWSEGEEKNLINRLSRRVYDYTNFELGLNLTEHGQEPLMSIQYFGRGYNDTEPDRYTPHCDGECAGEPHKTGSRMATMVIYCQIPEKGGHTNFQNAGVHVRPSERAAIFFSYIDPDTNITDNGLTQHSGCPVFEGEKKIVTQWVRYGVSNLVPWGSFNTLGVLHKEDGN